MTAKYRDKSTGLRGLLRFAMMRPISSSPAFVAAGALAWGCAIYDSSLVPSNDSLVGTGDAPSTAGRSGNTNESGSSSSTAGKTATTTGGKSGDAGSATSGTSAIPEGGEGGDAPIVNGGSGGSGGTGTGGGGIGGASKGGSGGTGGKAGSGGAAGSAGSGGSGGSAPVAKCADHPIPLKTTWVATASTSSVGNGMESDGLYNPPIHLTDGLLNERWSSGQSQSGDEWIQIDFGVVVNITQLTLNVNQDTGDYPRAYAVRVSNTSQDFAVAVKSSGAGALGNTVITWPSLITGRYLTVRQTGVDVDPDTAWWTVAEVLVGCTD
jgi:F5/8 type C domain